MLHSHTPRKHLILLGAVFDFGRVFSSEQRPSSGPRRTAHRVMSSPLIDSPTYPLVLSADTRR